MQIYIFRKDLQTGWDSDVPKNKVLYMNMNLKNKTKQMNKHEKHAHGCVTSANTKCFLNRKKFVVVEMDLSFRNTNES